MLKILITALVLSFVLAAPACDEGPSETPAPSMPIITPVPAGTR